MSTSSLASCASDGTTGSCSASPFSGITAIHRDMFFEKCPRCKIQFDFLKRVNVTKVPLILPCKHTVCEDCIKRMVMSNTTVCPVCKVKFGATRAQVDTLSDLFPPNYTMIGRLVWSKNSSPSKNISLVSTGCTLAKRNSRGSDVQDFSFSTEIGDDGDADFGKETVPLVFEKCIEHTDHYVNIQCDECHDIYCCYCFLENHGGHKATYLYKLSETESEELDKLKSEVEVILAQLLVSKKQAKELKSADLSHVDFDIKNYFAELHTKLHVAESNIKKRLLNVESEDVDLEAVNSTLKSGIYRTNKILNHFSLLNTKQLNVRALYEEAKEIRNIPCRLVSDQAGIRPVEFLSDNVFDDIEETICLKTLPPMEYSLEPIEDWSQAQEKFEVQQMKRQTELRSPSEPKTEIVKTMKRAEKTTKKSAEALGGTVRAIVTHINSLDSFFIQKYTALDALKEVNTNIGKKLKKRGAVEDYKIGGIYGVCYETRTSNHWRRGKLVGILKNHEPVQYKMYFLDYGNSQIVTADKLKMLDIRTITRPPFAYECKLTNPNQVEFESNAHMRLPQIIGDREMYVRFIERQANRNTVQEVDLLLTTSSGGFMSVRDLLSKTPVTPPAPVQKSAVLMSRLIFFENSKKFSNGEEAKVVVTYVRDPFHICVQMAQNVRLMEKMKDDLENYYKDKPKISCIPVADSDMIVKYEDEKHGNWHRVKIIAVDLANKEVDVYFVDWGYSTVVPWSSLRLLTENFIKYECQGIIVKLAAIEKLDMAKPWSDLATHYIREFVGNEECKMVVSSPKPLEVVLFQSRPAADVCLNALLVENKHAISTGPSSQTVCWPNMEAETNVEDEDFSFQMVKKSGAIIEADEDVHLKTGMKFQVSVVNFQSPDLIYVKFNKYKDVDDELHKELQIHYSSSKNKIKLSWKVGEKCVVLDSVRNNYFRAIIKSACEKDNYIVYLYDHVRELKVSRKYIFEQHVYFQQKFLCSVVKCRLSNIKPAGDAGKWSSLAVEMLQKIFATYKTIYIKKIELNERDKMLGVVMWYCLTTPAKALEPARVKYVSVNRTLIESGVAFGSSSEVNGLTGNKVVEETKPDAKSKDWYAMICEDEEKCTEKEDESEETSDDELHEIGQNGWPEPFKIEHPEFDAILTCVDNEGHFSVRSLEMDEYYRELEHNMTQKISSMQVTTDSEWGVGNMCTIRYEGKWYRGAVLDIVNDEEISVEMIDFGSEHTVTKDQLTKLIMFPDIPPLMNKVKLYDVYYPRKGLWTGDDVNDILSIAPNSVRVVIKQDLDANIPYAELYFENGLSLNDLIVQKCPHMKRYENKIALGNLEDVEMVYENGSTEEEENVTNCEPDKNYNYVCLSPTLNRKQKLFVVSVLKLDSSYNVVLSPKDPPNTELVGLHEEFQTQAAEQPSLKAVELNEPCICMHAQKKVWSRAVVFNIDSLKFGYVSVFFVDYGTVEIVPDTAVKEIRPEWLDLPVEMQLACINIELVQNNQSELVLMRLNSLRGKKVSVEVVSKDPLKVHLYDEENLFYKNLVDCGIVRAL